MAVALSINLCQDISCQFITFSDTTGAYSLTNLSGYGSPNEATAGALGAVLTVIDPNNNSYSINLLAQNPAWPTATTTQGYNITLANLSQTNKFIDGEYNFTYTVTYADSTSSTVNINQLMYCNIECCVSQMFANITDPECECQAADLATAMKASSLLIALKRAAKCGNVANFNIMITVLNRLCQNINCETCS